MWGIIGDTRKYSYTSVSLATQMNTYTSDGLLLSAASSNLTASQGQRLISIYRLFLQLHAVGQGGMRIKEMMKPDSTTSPEGSDTITNTITTAAAATGLDPRQPPNRRGRGGDWPAAAAPAMTVLMPAYTTTGTTAAHGNSPYPIFLLSSNAIPPTPRLRGFAAVSTIAPGTATAAAQIASAAFAASPTFLNAAAKADTRRRGTTSAAMEDNNNRSANGCDEIPLRWGLLMRSATHRVAAAMPAGGAAGGGDTAGDNIESELTPVASLQLHSFASGWAAAELQVSTSTTVYCCAPTELPHLGILSPPHAEGRRNDENATAATPSTAAARAGATPIIFCCTASPTTASAVA